MKTKIIRILWLAAFLQGTVLPVLAQDLHEPWDRQLQAHVKKGWVDYPAWKKKEKDLDGYLQSLKDLSPEGVKSLPREARLALYINAYNAYTVKAVLSHPGISSIRDIKPNVWKQKTVWIAGQKMSLDHLEHKILRPRFDEPRVHFAIVCASISCPKLRSRAFAADSLEAQLTAATREFLANSSENVFSPSKTELSKIFKWFKKDFTAYQGGLEGFLKRYAPEEYHPSAKVSYKDYDWGLNGKKL